MTRAWVCVACCLLTAPVLAQEEAKPDEESEAAAPAEGTDRQPPVEMPLPPTRDKLEPEYAEPAVGLPTNRRVDVRIKASSKPAKPRAARGSLADVRAISIDEQEARLVVKGARRTLRVGDRLGRDVVKSLSPGRLVLDRPADVDPELGACLVIVTFDADGRARERVIAMRRPAEEPPEPKR